MVFLTCFWLVLELKCGFDADVWKLLRRRSDFIFQLAVLPESGARVWKLPGFSVFFLVTLRLFPYVAAISSTYKHTCAPSILTTFKSLLCDTRFFNTYITHHNGLRHASQRFFPERCLSQDFLVRREERRLHSCPRLFLKIPGQLLCYTSHDCLGLCINHSVRNRPSRSASPSYYQRRLRRSRLCGSKFPFIRSPRSSRTAMDSR